MSSPLKAETPGKVQEPSMEEILASIRKIISDDDTKPAKPAPSPVPVAKAPPPPPPAPAGEPQGQDDIDALFASFDDPAPPEPEPEPEADVFELTEEMAAPPESDDVTFLDPEPELPPLPPPPPKPVAYERPAMPQIAAQPPRRADDRLISSATDSAISAAFGSLTHTILSQNARTLDDLVQDMLRPMLKHWLDDNLPSVVERLVRAEIERVSRGGR
jgi:uncharacterized protein